MTIKAKRIRSKNAWNTQFYLIQVTCEYHVDQTSFELINRRSYFEHCAYFQRHSLWPRVQCLWPHFRDRLLFIARGGWRGAENFRGDHLIFRRTKGGGTVESHGNQTRLCWSSGEVTSNIAPTFRDKHCDVAYDVCDRLSGTGHYLSPGGGDRRILGRITWLLGEQKGGSVVIEIPKGGSLETLEGFRGGTTQICLENGDDISTGIPNSVGLLHSRF